MQPMTAHAQLTVDCESCHGNLHIDIIGGIAHIHACHQWLGVGNGQGTCHLAISYSIHRLHQHTSRQSLWTIPSEREPRDGGSGETFSHTCEGSTVWGDHCLIHRGCGDIRTNCKMETNRDWHITCQCIYTYLAR